MLYKNFKQGEYKEDWMISKYVYGNAKGDVHWADNRLNLIEDKSYRYSSLVFCPG